VIQNANIRSLRAGGSTIFITGIPYARDSYRQFLTPVYSVFNALARNAATLRGSRYTFIGRILSETEILTEYVRDHVQKAIVEMQISVPGSTDQGMNLAIGNCDRIQQHSAQWMALRDKYMSQMLPQTSALYDQLIYPLIFWNGEGGLGIIKKERLPGATTRIGKILICLMLQPRVILFTHS
jgi:hypothetical protein